VINAPKPAFLVTAKKQRSPPVGAKLVQNSDPAVAISKGDEALTD
jgi:hypothetical protein